MFALTQRRIISGTNSYKFKACGHGSADDLPVFVCCVPPVLLTGACGTVIWALALLTSLPDLRQNELRLVLWVGDPELRLVVWVGDPDAPLVVDVGDPEEQL